MSSDNRESLFKELTDFLLALSQIESHFKQNPSLELKQKIVAGLRKTQNSCALIRQQKFNKELTELAESVHDRIEMAIEFMDKIV